MPALITNDKIEKGADFQREYTVTNSGADIPDFAQGSARAVLRDASRAPVATFLATVIPPRFVLVALTPEQVADLPASRVPTHSFNTYYISPSGTSRRIGQSTVTISAE
jgi:hypothetical protein